VREGVPGYALGEDGGHCVPQAARTAAVVVHGPDVAVRVVDVALPTSPRGPARSCSSPAAPAGGGDVNGDGYADVLAETDSGSYLYLGGPSGPTTRAVALVVAVGENNSAGFGAIAIAGDVDGDGYADVLVGTPWSNAYVGGAYLLMGGMQGPGTGIAVTNPNIASSIFGASVAIATPLPERCPPPAIVRAPDTARTCRRASGSC
jgi:hypothetical protein